MGLDLGKDPLELGAVKLDENLAAVLVRKIGNFDAGRLQVFAVALIKRGENWEPAPLPASFENVGATYALALRKRVEELENWMLREQVRDLTRLREESENLLRSKIEATFSAKELESYDINKISDRFLTACEKADLTSLLGTVGGLETPLPNDWSLRLKSVESAIKLGLGVTRPWRLLLSPDVARVITARTDEGNTGMITIACLDPLNSKRVNPEGLQFQVLKSGGLWRIQLPDSLLRAASLDALKKKQMRAQRDPEEIPEQELDTVQGFSKAWLAEHKSNPQPTAEQADKAWLTAMNVGNFPSLLAITKTSDDQATTDQAYLSAAKNWADVRSGIVANVAVPLTFKADETMAVGIYQFFTARDPEKLNLRTAYFEKSKDGWLWSSNPSDTEKEQLKDWVEQGLKRQAEIWQGELLSNCPILANVEALESPSDQEVRDCVDAWLNAVGQGDFRAALSKITRFGGERSAKATLQNLGYEITAIRGCTPQPSIAATYQEKPWSAAAVRIQRNGTNSLSPLYTVIKTPDGPRILIETDLIASDNRNRDFLNNAALGRLGKATNADAESALRKILESHQSSDIAPPRKDGQ